MDNPQQPHDIDRDDIVVQHNTSERIIEILNELNSEDDYETVIPRILEMLSRIIHADRLYVLEQRQQRLDGRVFEWCAEGIAPRLGAVQHISDAKLAAFVHHFSGCGIIFAETLDELGFTDKRVTAFLQNQGVESMFIVPLRVNKRFVACLGGDNYTFEAGLDFARLLDVIAPFMATVVSNHQLLDELEWSGSHDELTGLMNRHGIDAASSAYVTANPNAPFVLALIDVDDFKTTNDLYGHAAGDEALRMLARAMQQAFPTDAILGRNGGDELLIMLLGECAARADELFAQFTQADLTFEHNDMTHHLTTSIGYAGYPEQADTLAAAYKQADAALYAMKLAGKAHAMRYSDEMNLQYRFQLGFTPRDIAENTPGAIMVHRAGGNGEVLFVNDEMIKLLECDDLNDFMCYVKGAYRYIVHPDDGPHVYEEIVEQIGLDDIGGTFTADYRILTKKGTVKQVAENGRLIEVADIGKVFYTLLIDRAGHSFHNV